mgnify:CR=1 FL=1
MTVPAGEVLASPAVFSFQNGDFVVKYKGGAHFGSAPVFHFSHVSDYKMDEKERIIRNIAANIAHLRTQSGMTQSELAEKLRYSDKAVSKWEKGIALPDIQTLFNMSGLFGITMEDLLTSVNLTAAV